MLRSRKKCDLEQEFKSVQGLITKSLNSLHAEIFTIGTTTFTESDQTLFEETVFTSKKIIQVLFYEADTVSLKNINLKMSILFLEQWLDILDEFLEVIAKDKLKKKNCFNPFTNKKNLSQKLLILSGKLNVPLGYYQSVITDPNNHLFCLHHDSVEWNNLRECTEIVYPKSKKKAKKDFKRLCSRFGQFLVITAKHTQVLPKNLNDPKFLVKTIENTYNDKRENNDGSIVVFPEISKCYLLKLIGGIVFSRKSYETICDEFHILQ